MHIQIQLQKQNTRQKNKKETMQNHKTLHVEKTRHKNNTGEKTMTKKCKFDKTKNCGYTQNYCQHCQIRKTIKQKLLTPESPETKTEITQNTESK